MKIVIDIPEKIYKELTETAIMVTEVYPSTIERALTEGIVLPKGHGRLIDAEDVNKHIVGWVNLRDCPTIIGADKEVGDGVD